MIGDIIEIQRAKGFTLNLEEDVGVDADSVLETNSVPPRRQPAALGVSEVLGVLWSALSQL